MEIDNSNIKQELKEYRILLSILEMLVSIYWIWTNLELFIMYKANPGTLWLIMFPDWYLILNSVIGLASFINGGYLMLNSSYPIKSNIRALLFLVTLVFIIELI